jgi:hypothetical protein
VSSTLYDLHFEGLFSFIPHALLTWTSVKTLIVQFVQSSAPNGDIEPLRPSFNARYHRYYPSSDMERDNWRDSE